MNGSALIGKTVRLSETGQTRLRGFIIPQDYIVVAFDEKHETLRLCGGLTAVFSVPWDFIEIPITELLEKV